MDRTVGVRSAEVTTILRVMVVPYPASVRMRRLKSPGCPYPAQHRRIGRFIPAVPPAGPRSKTSVSTGNESLSSSGIPASAGAVGLDGPLSLRFRRSSCREGRSGRSCRGFCPGRLAGPDGRPRSPFRPAAAPGRGSEAGINARLRPPAVPTAATPPPPEGFAVVLPSCTTTCCVRSCVSKIRPAPLGVCTQEFFRGNWSLRIL